MTFCLVQSLLRQLSSELHEQDQPVRMETVALSLLRDYDEDKWFQLVR